MNKIEKIIYNRIKSVPWIKFFIRNVYQTFFDFLPRKKEFSLAPIDFRVGYFFGFHDKSPFSEDNHKVLANRTLIPLRMPRKDEKLEVGYFHFAARSLDNYNKIGESLAWNYHKGCRLQWLDRDRLIYNTAQNGCLISKIIDINTIEEKIISFPIDTVSNDGKWATSFSYERLNALMPGYGYNYPDDGFLMEGCPHQTGLFLVDLTLNRRELLVSLNELAAGLNNSFVMKFNHYVTHTAFSYDGNYLSFLHRWTAKDNRKRTSRLVIYDLKMKNYFLAPTEGMISHYVWNRKNQIIAYCRIGNEDSHVLFNVPNMNDYRKIASHILNSDGHQSFISNYTFITDTYPDRYRMAKLYKVNIEQNNVELLASLYSPKKYQTRNFRNHIACDLHPRVSPDGKYLCFDAVRNGHRSLCLMELFDKQN